ncbi:MAG: class I SAM-dependent methyltransferase [Timaviella obliquedivisa GSE-PSE-MK23-08B]|jgi:2-polyprenyl-3-methyl-5-hydroxy-6-metoxy-1,4-benzoquinol methylase|nr:class I SAM-dependent methyltransferase [Timaviella obliquedivisa GSE-PSE-MK23-08B]
MNPQLLAQTELTELDKIRQQYDNTPYPKVPLETSPKADHESLYLNNLVTPYYLKYRQVVETEGKLILDAGCGSGYQALKLATANPGAKIVGVDLSPVSVEVAQARMKMHNCDNAECHTLSIFDLPQLGLEFDYINCDEVISLFPDPVAGLQALKSVLKPNGIIRTNFHNAYQRANFFRSQTLFKMLGLMDEGAKDSEHQAVIETMQALKDQVQLKRETWGAEFENPESSQTIIGMNHLLIGDHGFTIPDLFNTLERSDLEFFSMVEWRHWDILDLFKNINDLPALWDMSLAYASVEEKLHLFELLHPIHRLMDFWCTHSGVETGSPVDDWNTSDWQNSTVHVHPQLRHEDIKAEVLNCIESGRSLEVSRYIKKPALVPILLESTVLAWLLPLWEGSQSMKALCDRYLKIKPLHPITLEPLSESAAFEEVKTILNRMDAFLYLLVEK